MGNGPWNIIGNGDASLEEVLQMSLEDVKDYGLECSPRGRDSKEIIGYNFCLEDPLHRIVGFKARDLNPFYLVGNLLWVLRQSNKLDIINYYNPRGSMFSDDGEILRGAYGKRIFDFDGVNQWHQVVRELKADPDSRRAIITFHLPQHDWSGSLDTPCTASIQFFIRNNYLHMINHMRSQSAAFVMPYDVFLMTMLQELLARELGVQVGEYQHFCGSFHYFSNEENMVNAIIDSADYSDRMPEMPKGSNMPEVKRLLEFEKWAREYAIKCKDKGVKADEHIMYSKLGGMNSYWFHFGEVLIAKAMQYTLYPSKYGEFLSEDIMSQGNPFYKLVKQTYKG